MAIYLYRNKEADISKENMGILIGKEKYLEIEDVKSFELIFKKMTSDIYTVLSNCDKEVINLLISSKIKRKIHVVTKSVAIAKEVEKFVADVIVLDTLMEQIPSMWRTKITTIENMMELRKRKTPSVKFDLTDGKGLMLTYEIVEENKLYWLEFKCVKDKDSVKEFKNLLAKKKKESVKVIRESNAGTKAKLAQNITLQKQGERVNTYKDMEDYLVIRGYVTEEQINLIQVSDNPIEIRACEEGYYSQEDLIEIVRMYYNLDMLGKEDISNLVISFDRVTEGLRDKGVVEAYFANDDGKEDTLIIIPYTERGDLVNEVNATINYRRMYFTVPAYIKGLMQNAQPTP